MQGYKLGTQDRGADKHQRWLAEGHGPGLCLFMAAKVHGPVCSTTIPGMAEPQMKPEKTTSTTISTQAAPATDKMASQTSDIPEHQCTALQMELLDDKNTISMGRVATLICR